MRYISAVACFALLFVVSIVHAFTAPTTDLPPCNLPHADFKYSYMDSVISSVQRPDDNVFVSTTSNQMDVAKAQFYLWYLYKNPDLSDQFFRRVDVAILVDREEDSLNAIIWLMSKDERYFSSLQSSVRAAVISHLHKWKKKYEKISPERSLVLDIYGESGDLPNSLDRRLKDYAENDVDLIIRKGVRSEDGGRKLEALYYYTRVAEYGYRGGLIGAALLLPQLGGDACVSRAAYYVRLSGVTGPAAWLEKPY